MCSKGRFKVYLADAAIAPAIAAQRKERDRRSALLGVATETIFSSICFARYYSQGVRFTYWHGKRDREVDLVAEVGQQLIPSKSNIAPSTGTRELKG